jgi:glutathione S-transferase
MDYYYGRVSGNSSRVAFCLYELGIPFTPHQLDTRAGENQGDSYKAVNPMGKIPSIKDGDFSLWESNAINWYLAEKHPQAKLIPDGAEGRAEAHRWLFFQAAHVTPACVPVFRATNQKVIAFWGNADAAAAERGKKELARYLPVIEQRLQQHEWLVDRFSLADIAFAPHFYAIKEGHFDFSPYPKLSAWLDKLLARPAWKKAEALVFGD